MANAILEHALGRNSTTTKDARVSRIVDKDHRPEHEIIVCKGEGIIFSISRKGTHIRLIISSKRGAIRQYLAIDCRGGSILSDILGTIDE